MYHSLIISGKNTYDEWGLVPMSRPLVNPPAVKTTYVDLPASHGVLDYTSLLLAETPYGQREGSWEFYLKAGRSWANVYSDLMNFLHGERHTVILEDDPNFQYTGRLFVNSWKSDKNYSTITIGYNLDPFKYSVNGTEEIDWLWNDLFAEIIQYGTFNVSGTKYRNFINRGLRTAIPTFTLSSSMTVEFNGSSYGLMKGKNYNANLALEPGDNIMKFTGNGDVTVSYREVSL
ncbi:MAG: hypothetical protein IJH62_07190 [Mogibacterium sp.]|nr:hypothetical protein [Mogibacterium sp.]